MIMENRVSFIHLSRDLSNALLRAAAVMEAEGNLSGPLRHERLEELIRTWRPDARLDPERESPRNAHRASTRSPRLPKILEKAQALAHRWMALGTRVLGCRFPPGHPLESCPKYLFTWGTPPEPNITLCAAFNSRKGKHTHREDPWVLALRQVFEHMSKQPVGWVSSYQTPVYDLTSCWAQLYRKPLVLVAVPSRTRPVFQEWISYFPDLNPSWILSCLPGRAACSPSRYVVCRDRLVAALAQQFFVLAVRAHGNLAEVLWNELSSCPKHTWIFLSPKGSPDTEGNRKILDSFPHCTQAWPQPTKSNLPAPKPVHALKTRRSLSKPLSHQKGAFLFHYTRSCPGPWPAQSRCAWAEDLLKAKPWADHTALDTLWHILWERRVRACGRLIRHGIPVVSWSRVPPGDLSQLTRWNPALIRWTFEPYGIAVPRQVLQELGAKPVIYAGEKDYAKISAKDRFRFQLHQPGRMSWKGEREWRLPADLFLDQLDPETWWAFVPTLGEACWLQENLKRPCRIIPLSDLPDEASCR